ncbi:MAG: NAD-dependent epimerase/dehydratase family protein [Lentisphaerota bacterium]
MNIIEQDLEHILEHTRDLWDELRGKRIFITGGTGFFGRWLLESFSYANKKMNLNARVTVLSRNPDAFICRAPELCSNPAITFCRGDVRDFTYPKEDYPFIIHGATAASAKLNVNDLEPLVLFDTIVHGTRRTLDFAIQTHCHKFLFISSGAVYGKQPDYMTHIPESHIGGLDTIDPNSIYGEAKRAAELLCAIYHKRYPDIETKIARCFTFVGPHMPLNAHFAIGNFIRNALHGEQISVKGDGTPCRSYLYAADLTIWLWTILFRAQPCRPYNVGSGDSVSILETANAVANLANPPLPVSVALQPENRPTQRYVPNVSRAELELGLTRKISLRDSIYRTMSFSTYS